MRGVRIGLAVLLVGLGAALPARAGVYNTLERPGLPPLDKMKFWVSELRGVRTLPGARPALQGSQRQAYEREAAALEAQQKVGELSTLDRVNLGACYIRMGKYQDAIRVLEAADRRHFLVLANLATAYHGIDQLDRALAYQRQALDAWPPVWAGWTLLQLQGYRRVERYYLTLLQSRYREQVRAGGRPVPMTNVDELFPRVRFVGPGGHYGPGEMAQEYRDEVPPDALLIVWQLVVWQPYDDRLYWLLGELLNAGGHVQAAYDVFDELVYARRVAAPELARHRQALRGVLLAYKGWSDPRTQLSFLCALTPPGAGALAPANAVWAKDFQPAPAVGPGRPPAGAPAAPAAPVPNWLPDWRQLTVGFGAGVVVAELGALQWREWRRRRPAPLPAPHGAYDRAPAAAGPGDAIQDVKPGERGASAP